MMHAPFSNDEFAGRTKRAQDAMARAGLAALLLTTEPEVRYFSGFLTRFWESPTRPWFVVVPSRGKPIAVIPAIGAPLRSRAVVVLAFRWGMRRMCACRCPTTSAWPRRLIWQMTAV